MAIFLFKIVFINYCQFSMLENGLFSVSGNNIKKDFELLTRALDAAIPGIIITDNIQPDNPIIYCNAAFEKMTGYDRKEIIGRNCRFLQNQDRNQPASQAIRNAVQTGKSCVVEMRNYKKNGTLFWNELFISPVFNTEGEVAYFIAVQNDISIRKKAALSVIQYQAEMEAKVKERTRLLKESEEYLQSIIHTIRECLIVLDPDLNVLDVNEHFLKTFKVSRQETRGRTLYELGNGQWNIPRLKDLLENILPSNNPVVEFEVEHEFPHIGKKLMLLNAHRIELEGQFKNQILIAIEDITDRRQIERRKDDFLSIASHELRTPLTTIKGYVQIMDRLMPENAGEKFRNVVAKTALYVDRLNNLIAELLDV